jgi:hypothetical protein
MHPSIRTLLKRGWRAEGRILMVSAIFWIAAAPLGAPHALKQRTHEW